MMRLIKLIFFCLVIFSPLKAIESYIVLKVDNEIITNIDLETEYKYLIVLNNELENTDKDTMLELAKESIIREKLKKNEILNYYELNGKQDYLDDVVKDYYERLNIKNLNDFQNYLSEYGLKLENVVKKIEIELMWNKLIGYKYSSQININEKLLKEQIENSSKNDKIITEYELSEILFQANSDSELSNKINLIQQDINKQGFKNSANIHSLSDSSKFGGNIGWFNEKQLSKKINLIIEKLDVGEVSKPIQIANNFLILKIENKKQKKNKLNKKKLLKEAILFEQNKQYSQFSIIHFNKVKINSIISE
jgi:peptidyl-prolyl cis-trans isomerase SurA